MCHINNYYERRQSPAVFLGTVCRGDDQVLDEGRMIPSWSMCSSACLAAQSRSGARDGLRLESLWSQCGEWHGAWADLREGWKF